MDCRNVAEATKMATNLYKEAIHVSFMGSFKSLTILALKNCLCVGQVSARFWLMDCRNVAEATKMATNLYKEAIHVPFMSKFVVFSKRHEQLEVRILSLQINWKQINVHFLKAFYYYTIYYLKYFSEQIFS
jgi:hypothetical protein